MTRRIDWRRRSWLRMMLGMGVIASSLLALTCALQRKVLFPAPSPPRTSPASGRSDVQTWWLGPDRVEAWYLPAHARPADGAASTGRVEQSANAGESGPALIFTHGNGELIDDWLEAFEVPRHWGWAVLLVEYPGYGRSGGSPSEEDIQHTMLAAYDALRARPEIDGERIVAYGRSVGGGAACALAANRAVAGLILESTFTSVREIASGFGFPAALIADPFDNRAVVARYEGPTLIVHGTNDGIVPFEHALELHSVAKHSKLEPLACGHNDCPRPWGVIREFLREVQGTSG